jgi:hypothetical protein
MGRDRSARVSAVVRWVNLATGAVVPLLDVTAIALGN